MGYKRKGIYAINPFILNPYIFVNWYGYNVMDVNLILQITKYIFIIFIYQIIPIYKNLLSTTKVYAWI